MKYALYCLYASGALLLGGCSNKLSLPWENNLLDPARIATREPLEIPPDLNTLPPPGAAKKPALSHTIPWINPAQAPKSGGNSPKERAQTIHLPPQSTENTDDTSLSRNEQEKLPAWME